MSFESGKLGKVYTAATSGGAETLIGQLNAWDLAFSTTSEDTTIFSATASYYGTQTVVKVDASGSFSGFFDSTNSLSPAQKVYMKLVMKPGAQTTLDSVLDIQTDATLDPGATPTLGDRYILTDTAALHANFGTITGVGDDDIVEFNGTEFIVIYDASANADGDIVYDEDSQTNYAFASATGWTATTDTQYFYGLFQVSNLSFSVSVTGVVKFTGNIVNADAIYKNATSGVPYGDQNI